MLCPSQPSLLSSLARGVESGEYLMLKSFVVENFRCLKHNELTDLRRVNVLVGKNAAGKTALMESIRLGLDGLPATIPWLEGQRGIQYVFQQNLSNEQFRAIFVDIFHNFDTDLTISTEAQDSADRSATLNIQFDNTAAMTVQNSLGFGNPYGASGQSVTPPASIIPLAFSRKDFAGQRSKLLFGVQPNGMLLMQPGKPFGLSCAFFSSAAGGNANENAGWLSDLSISKRSGDVIAAVQRHFPFVKDISSETRAPGLSSVYANIPSLANKLPLSLVSGGISRLFTFILAIVRHSRGVVCIDEIENGLYYDQYPMLWRTLCDLARQYETQLFVSTHSWDCLKHLAEVMKGSEEDFKLLRFKKENGSSRIEEIKGDLVEAALEQNVEIR